MIAARVLSLTLLLAAEVLETEVPADDASLHTVVYRPEGNARVPTILVRTPYSIELPIDGIANLADSHHSAWVFQNVRGQHGSTGEYCFFTCAQDDSNATVEWIEAQEWSNGVVALSGGSAMGMLAIRATPAAPSSVVAASISMSQGSLYDSFFPGGVLRNSLRGWLEGVVTDDAARRYWLEHLEAHPVVDEGSVWPQLEIAPRAPEISIPILHATGWYDLHVASAIDSFQAIQEHGGPGARGRQRLIISPWGHATEPVRASNGSIEYGDVVLPETALETPHGPIGRLETEWLLHHFGESSPTVDALAPVTYWVFGDPEAPRDHGNRWATAPAWPPAHHVESLWLTGQGQLSCARSEPDEELSRYVSDGTSPTPVIGGRNLGPVSGPFDQRPLEGREDVAVFTSEAFEQPVELTGPIRANLRVSIDQPDADVMVRATDVYPDGRSIFMTEGVLRLAARERTHTTLSEGEVIDAAVELGDVAYALAPGHRLRLIVSSTMSPSYFVNPGDGSYFEVDPEASHPPLSVGVSVYGESRVDLPVRNDWRPGCDDGSRPEEDDHGGEGTGGDPGSSSSSGSEPAAPDPQGEACQGCRSDSAPGNVAVLTLLVVAVARRRRW